MRRLNSSGIERSRLAWALTQPRLVQTARAEDSCLLCRAGQVNEAALCPVCQTMLSDEESRLAERWMNGVGP